VSCDKCAKIAVQARVESKTFDDPLTGLSWQAERWTQKFDHNIWKSCWDQ